MKHKVDDVRILEIKELSAPNQIFQEIAITENANNTVYSMRSQIHHILHGADDRLLVIVGPCSIHDYEAAIEHGTRLKEKAIAMNDDLLIVMRVYFEKPRTTVGWKGLINDPYLDNSFSINDGLRLARKLLLELNEMGVACGTEFLDVITPQYTADLVSWGAIGARTTESQIHRELASGLSAPVGFKNGTDGNVRIAVEAIQAAAAPHHFLSVTKSGHSAIVSTSGNEDCHMILRGGKEPNYAKEAVEKACSELMRLGIPARLMIDCSHANSLKQFNRQLVVAQNIAEQLAAGEKRIFGVMVESHLKEGRQDLNLGKKKLQYGVSITDSCLGWTDTELLLATFAEGVRKRRIVQKK